MKIAICDDSITEQNTIKQYCIDAGEDNVTLFSSGEQFLNSPDSFDLLFLDIEMNELSGIDVMHNFEMKHSDMLIVFCTSHQEKSIETHGRNVINFLTKPVTPMEIERCLMKTRKLSDRFHIIKEDKKELLCSDILYIKVESPYTVFYTKDSSTYLSYNTLQDWMEKLACLPFHKINRSYIVNFQNTLDVVKNQIILCTGERLPISRRLVSLLANEYKTYHREQMRY